MIVDVGTYLVFAAFATFWLFDLVQMLRHRATLSSEIGDWSRGHLWRYIAIAAFFLFITLHLEFFP